MKENGGFYKYPGGTKKFLYTGSKKDEQADEDQWSFAPKGSAGKSASKHVDLNDVWSIQKNVSLGGLGSRSSDRLTHNASKGFYSRHGGMKDSSRNGISDPADKTGHTAQWSAARGGSFSYSYTGGRSNANNDDASSVASTHVSRGYHSNPSPRPRRFDNSHAPADENDF